MRRGVRVIVTRSQQGRGEKMCRGTVLKKRHVVSSTTCERKVFWTENECLCTRQRLL